MEIKKGVLLSVTEQDLENGVFYSDKVIEVADKCFYDMRTLAKVVLPKCKKIGNYCFSYNDKLTAIDVKALTTCGNDCFSSNASLTAIDVKALTTCGNYCFRYNDKLTAIDVKALTTCGNDCFSYNDKLTAIDVKALTTCGNDCFRYNASLTAIDVKALTTCGNDCFRYNDKLTAIDVKALTTCGNYCFSSNASLTALKISKYKLDVKNVDGYCFVIENKKSTKGIKIYTGYNLLGLNKKVLNKHICFVAEKENFTAHGETVKKAIGDLNFKIVSEKLKKDPINKDTLFTVKYYRLLTGACDMGCRDFMKRHNIAFEVLNKGLSNEETMEVKPIKAVELLDILEKEKPYGYDKFKSLINW